MVEFRFNTSQTLVAYVSDSLIVAVSHGKITKDNFFGICEIFDTF